MSKWIGNLVTGTMTNSGRYVHLTVEPNCLKIRATAQGMAKLHGGQGAGGEIAKRKPKALLGLLMRDFMTKNAGWSWLFPAENRHTTPKHKKPLNDRVILLSPLDEVFYLADPSNLFETLKAGGIVTLTFEGRLGD